MSEAAAERTKSDEEEAQGVWIEPDEADLASDDLRTTENVQISHPTRIGGPKHY